jgi:MFS transporter, putative metabolite:H+ symporter
MDSDSTLINWIDKFGMQCAPKQQFGMFGSMFFAGVVIGSLVLPRLSDIYGRRKIAIIGNYMHLIPGSIFLMTQDFYLSLLLIFFMGIAMGGRVFVGYVWMSENMRVKDVSKATAAMFTIDALAIYVAAVYFKRHKDWTLLFGIPLLIQCFAIVGLLLQFDSPKFYHGVGDYEMARKALTHIGRVNGKLSRTETYSKTFTSEISES